MASVRDLGAVTLVAALFLSACGGAAREQRQRALADELAPAELEVAKPPAEKVRVGRVRIYADSAYAAQNPRWQKQLANLVSRANRALEPGVGLRLEIVESLTWARQSSRKDLLAMLGELEMLDGATDVDWVIGFVDALPEVSASIHQLGLARPLGTHLVMRGLNDAAETKVFDAAFDELNESERKTLYARRKRHKELVLFLHEFCHTLGGIHTNDPQYLLHQSYESSQIRFAQKNYELMRLAVTDRLAEEAELGESPRWSRLLAHIEATEWQAWSVDERNLMIQILKERVEGAAAGKTGIELGTGVRPADREAFTVVVKLSGKGRHDEAWERLEPLLDFYPDEPAVQLLACRIASKRTKAPGATRKQCGRAMELNPKDLEAPVLLAAAVAGAEDTPREDSFKALEVARERLLASGANRPEEWSTLAKAYKAIEVVGRAEEAAGRGKGVSDVTDWTSHNRARYALPPNAESEYGIQPLAEWEYIEAVKGMLKLVYAKKYGEADRALARAGRKYRNAPGIAVVRCDLEIRRKAYPAASAQCDRAIKQYEGASWAHYLKGLLEKRKRARKVAIQHLRRAIELDPKHAHAYKVLAELYTETGQKQELAELQAKYKDTFGSVLQ